ncbi:MAG: nitroreductase family protein [Promethearchaeota archaeon]
MIGVNEKSQNNKKSRERDKFNDITFNKSILDIINARFSIRAYFDKPLNLDLKKSIRNILTHPNINSPFREKVANIRFKLINFSELDQDINLKTKTIGGIYGAHDYIVGAMEQSEYDFEHYGYVFETIILKMTELRLGTCWLGGFFNRKLFADKIQKRPNEIIPAITPVGTPDYVRLKAGFGMKTNFDRIRLPVSQLFFEGDFTNPINFISKDPYSVLLEMVRISPSASNLQPWRIVKDKKENIFHFYTLSTRDRVGLIYNNFRRIDIGIAVCHFDLASKFLNLKGNWEFKQQIIPSIKYLKYIISWSEKN